MKTNKLVLSFKKISADVSLPRYETKGAAGADLKAYIPSSITIEPGEHRLISTGLFPELSSGYEMQVRPRSGLALKYGITILNSPGTVDSDYRGELKVNLINLSDKPFVVNNGDRIAQIVISPVIQVEMVEVDSITPTERGEGGFGSTGV